MKRVWFAVAAIMLLALVPLFEPEFGGTVLGLWLIRYGLRLAARPSP